MQMRTVIQYGDLQDFTFKWANGQEDGEVATSMHAELDPADPKTGSDTGGSDAFDDLMKALEAHTNTTWVRGHLLNHDLGGLAIYNNLFPITTAANSAHYHEVEKNVKHWIGEGCEVEYNVDAKQSKKNGSPDGVFVCDAEVTADPNGTGLLNEKIHKVIVSHGNTTPTTQIRYANKADKNVTKHAGVLYGADNTVYRDSYRRRSRDQNWDHQGGNGRINNVKAAKVNLSPVDVSSWESHRGRAAKKAARKQAERNRAWQSPLITGNYDGEFYGHEVEYF